MNASSASGLWPILTVGMPRLARLAGGEAQPELTRTDRANDRVAFARGVDLDPRLAEVDGPVGVVGRDLHERDLGGLVDRPTLPGLRDLDRVEVEAAGTDTP